ncbi:MAG TPA: patatin-like phospholipase family protein [Bryobacteraceae bacterium]|jgi:NTE family protein|nr:patatin-like phospholipase family protein [Bryobacteraceae bacterium]
MQKHKTALVLSGGGMFGAYQAGAWKVLSQEIEIDMVVGASVGAINGWSIAGGCTADELIGNWRDPETGQALKLFDSRPLRAMAERLHSRYTPRIPYGLVMLELASMKTRLVRHPEVGPEHIHAACAIPFFVPPVKIGGKRYVDGGVLAKLPVFGAVEMGATRVIAIDVLPEFSKWRTYPFDIELTVLKPSMPLGGMRDLFYWKRDLAERWIQLGLRDAAAIARFRRSA